MAGHKKYSCKSWLPPPPPTQGNWLLEVRNYGRKDNDLQISFTFSLILKCMRIDWDGPTTLTDEAEQVVLDYLSAGYSFMWSESSTWFATYIRK